VVDRVVVEPRKRARIADSVETALKHGGGIVNILTEDGEEHLYSEHYACIHCGVSYEELSPRMFSFNNPYGACPECSGLGYRKKIDPGGSSTAGSSRGRTRRAAGSRPRWRPSAVSSRSIR
jgi:excinuclease ABC subunit A